jgi:transketolase
MTTTAMDLQVHTRVARMAWGIRRHAYDVTVRANGCYLGQALSAAEILAAIHCAGLDRRRSDMFVLSPAHYSIALYATLVELGELPATALEEFGTDGSMVEMIGGIGAPGMEFTTGSLAQGLSQGIGVALGRRLRGSSGHVWVMISDGELEEGQTWEAFMSLAHYGLTNITVFLDNNDSQVDGSPAAIMAVEPIHERIAAFGLDVRRIDGHDITALLAAIEEPRLATARVVVCDTDIARGIPSLADREHPHWIRFRPGEAEIALAELLAGEPS